MVAEADGEALGEGEGAPVADMHADAERLGVTLVVKEVEGEALMLGEPLKEALEQGEPETECEDVRLA